MEVSVVIPSYSGARRLPETLRSIAAAARPEGAFEVVIADDGSPEALPEVLVSGLRIPVRILRWSTNVGRAAARNRAVAAARGSLILALDDDMTVQPDVLVGHVAAHRASPRPSVILGRIQPDPRSFRGPFGRFLAAEEAARRERLRANPLSIEFSDWMSGHFSIPRELFLAAGGFAEEMSGYGFEDLELGFRLGRMGISQTYHDELVATHRSENVDFRRHCRRHLQVGAMAVRFAERHSEPRIRSFLRIDDLRLEGGWNRFHRLIGMTHGAVRSSPAVVRFALTETALATVVALERLLPVKLRHLAYHVVRDMFYARGIAVELVSRPRGAP